MPSPAERLAAIAARADAATPNWAASWEGQSYVVRDEHGREVMQQTFPLGFGEDWASAEFRESCDTAHAVFIAAARQDVPWLLDRLASREAFAQAVLALCDDVEQHIEEAIAYDGMDRDARVTTDSLRRLADEHLGGDR